MSIRQLTNLNDGVNQQVVRKGFPSISRDIYGQIQCYLYIDDITPLLVTNRSINNLVINHITFHPFDVHCQPVNEKSFESREQMIKCDYLSLSCLNALTTISRCCRGTIRHVIFPRRRFPDPSLWT
jgi:hypothetical protein